MWFYIAVAFIAGNVTGVAGLLAICCALMAKDDKAFDTKKNLI